MLSRGGAGVWGVAGVISTTWKAPPHQTRTDPTAAEHPTIRSEAEAFEKLQIELSQS